MLTLESLYWSLAIGAVVGIAAKVLNTKFGMTLGGGEVGVIGAACVVLMLRMQSKGYSTAFTATILTVVAGCWLAARVMKEKWKD